MTYTSTCAQFGVYYYTDCDCEYCVATNANQSEESDRRCRPLYVRGVYVLARSIGNFQSVKNPPIFPQIFSRKKEGTRLDVRIRQSCQLAIKTTLTSSLLQV